VVVPRKLPLYLLKKKYNFFFPASSFLSSLFWGMVYRLPHAASLGEGNAFPWDHTAGWFQSEASSQNWHNSRDLTALMAGMTQRLWGQHYYFNLM